jgi:hypothetical protein
MKDTVIPVVLYATPTHHLFLIIRLQGDTQPGCLTYGHEPRRSVRMRNGDLKAGNSYFFLFTPVVAGRPTATTDTDPNQENQQERGQPSINHFTDTNQYQDLFDRNKMERCCYTILR